MDSREICGQYRAFSMINEQLTCHVDACRTDLFTDAWFCQQCGAEICGHCRDDMKDNPEAVSLMKLLSRRCTKVCLQRRRGGMRDAPVHIFETAIGCVTTPETSCASPGSKSLNWSRFSPRWTRLVCMSRLSLLYALRILMDIAHKDALRRSVARGKLLPERHVRQGTFRCRTGSWGASMR